MSLRLKLSLLFLVFALVPTLLLYRSARDQLSGALGLGLNAELATSLEKAKELGDRLAGKEKEDLAATLSLLSENQGLAAALAAGDGDSLARLLRVQRQNHPLGQLAAYDAAGHLLAQDPSGGEGPLTAEERSKGRSWEVPLVLEFDADKGRLSGGAPVFHGGRRVGFLGARSPLGAFYRDRLGLVRGTLESYAALLGRRPQIERGLRRRLQAALGLIMIFALALSLYVTEVLLVPFRLLSEKAGREQAWREAAQTIAHEIKNPLTPMALAVEKLGPRQGKAKAVLHREIENLRRLASGFSQYARLPKARLEGGDLGQVAGAVAELYSAGGRLHWEPAAGPLPVRVDSGLLRQALINLIENALKASPAGAPVSLGLLRSESEPPSALAGLGNRDWILPPRGRSARAWIWIRDQGRGIAAGDRRRIFEPHVALAPGGSGLGLALVLRIAEDHGAALGLQSRQGKGSAFLLGLDMRAS